MNLEELLNVAATQRNLRESTKYNYRRQLLRIGVVDDSLSKAELESRLFEVNNVNTRRATVIAIRSVLGHNIKLPRQQNKRVVLPTEDQLRFALMCSKYEVRGLLMAYAGLRIGEACAVTHNQLSGDRLLVDRQVLQFHSGNDPDGNSVAFCRLAPVKTNEATIVVPHWLSPMIEGLTEIDRPNRVRANFRYLSRKHGITMNPHALRHWYATTLLDRGANMKLVSQQLRHSDVATTLRTYAQTNDEDVHRIFG